MREAGAKTSQAPSGAVAPRVLLNCDDSGSWTLSGQDSPARHFPDFGAALSSARHVPGAEATTIEVRRGGEYICCLPPKEWPHREASILAAPIASRGRGFTTADRYANRAAQVLMATAGPIFWVVLVFLAVAASLGWRLLLL